jgi:hypothetical protein
MVARTKSKIACFAALSFHDGSGPPAAAVCAGAETGRRVPAATGSIARVESMARRLMPAEAAIGFMVSSCVT